MTTRNNRKEYDNFHGKEKEKRRRAQRNAANRKKKKEGKLVRAMAMMFITKMAIL